MKKQSFINKGKEQFDFNIQKELVRYKMVTGEKLLKKDEQFIAQYNKMRIETNGELLNLTDEYENWKNQIKQKYSTYSKEELESFLFYLEHGVHVKKRSKEMTIVLATPLIVGVVLNFSEKYFVLNDNPIVFLVAFICLMVLSAVYFYQGIDLLVKYNLEQKLYKDYGNIINKILNKE